MSVDTSSGHEAMDYTEHKRTYAGFVRGTTVSIVLLTLLLMFLAVFVA